MNMKTHAPNRAIPIVNTPRFAEPNNMFPRQSYAQKRNIWQNPISRLGSIRNNRSLHDKHLVFYALYYSFLLVILKQLLFSQGLLFMFPILLAVAIFLYSIVILKRHIRIVDILITIFAPLAITVFLLVCSALGCVIVSIPQLDSSINTEQKRIAAVTPFFDGSWDEMDTLKRAEVMAATAAILSDDLGIAAPERLVVKDMDFLVFGQYDYRGGGSILINKKHLMSRPPELSLNTLVHELAHAYQHHVCRFDVPESTCYPFEVTNQTIDTFLKDFQGKVPYEQMLTERQASKFADDYGFQLFLDYAYGILEAKERVSITRACPNEYLEGRIAS